jgi:argininosuccinate lyase
MYRDATRAVTLVAAAMRGADFDVARLAARASDGGTTLTELADTLVRDHGLAFRSAHGIAALLLKARTEDPEASLSQALATASQALLGQTLSYTEEQLQTVMSPRHFVEVRTTHGGPSPRETLRALTAAKDALVRDRAAWQARRDRIAGAERLLRDQVAAL